MTQVSRRQSGRNSFSGVCQVTLYGWQGEDTELKEEEEEGCGHGYPRIHDNGGNTG